MHQPYTYLIKHIPTGKVYYGLRFAKGCHPGDLWVKYFTSSKDVQTMIAEYGKDSFTTEIRKVFIDPAAAVKWEITVLRRMKVLGRPDFINRNIPGTTVRFVLSDETKAKMRKPKSVPRTKEHSEKIAAQMRGISRGANSPDHRANISKGKKGKNFGRVGENAPRYGTKKSTAEVEKMKQTKLAQQRRWLNNGTHSEFVLAEEIDIYLARGYNIGRGSTKFKQQKESF